MLYGEEYAVAVANGVNIDAMPLIRISTRQFNDGYVIGASGAWWLSPEQAAEPAEPERHCDYDLWIDYEDGTCDVIDPSRLVVFGEIGSPETSSVTVRIDSVVQCPCGRLKSLEEPWLAAHWTERLKFNCERCEQQFLFQAGQLSLDQVEVWQAAIA
jgi:hypothetical protein